MHAHNASRTRHIILASAVALATPLGASAQQPAASGPFPPAAALIARYDTLINAPAILGAPAITTHGTFQIPSAGMTASFEMVQTGHDRVRMTATIPGAGAMQTGFDGTTGWSVNPMQGPRIATGAELVQMRDEADRRAVPRVASLFSSMQTVADTTMDGERCYLVKLTWKSGRVTYDCYSPTTGYLVATRATQQSPMGAMDVVTTYGPYAKFGSISLPTRTVMQAMGQQQIITITGAELTPVPAGATSPPPEIQTLMASHPAR